MKLSMGYPDKEDEIKVLSNQTRINPIEQLIPVVTKEALRKAQEKVKTVKVSDAIKEYIVHFGFHA